MFTGKGVARNWKILHLQRIGCIPINEMHFSSVGHYKSWINEDGRQDNNPYSNNSKILWVEEDVSPDHPEREFKRPEEVAAMIEAAARAAPWPR